MGRSNGNHSRWDGRGRVNSQWVMQGGAFCRPQVPVGVYQAMAGEQLLRNDQERARQTEATQRERLAPVIAAMNEAGHSMKSAQYQNSHAAGRVLVAGCRDCGAVVGLSAHDEIAYRGPRSLGSVYSKELPTECTDREAEGGAV